MSKALMIITVFLFFGAMSDFIKEDPVVYHVPGQPVTVNEVLATMTTSYMLHHASEERQLLYVVFSVLPIGLAFLWGAFDRRQSHRSKLARAFGGTLFVFGSMFAGMLPAFSVLNPTNADKFWTTIAPGFVLAAVFLAASWPLCFRLNLASANGAPVQRAIAVEHPPATCSKCNAVQPHAASFCYQCGAALLGDATPPPIASVPVQTSAPSRLYNNKKGLGAIVVGAIILFVLAGIWVGVRSAPGVQRPAPVRAVGTPYERFREVRKHVDDAYAQLRQRNQEYWRKHPNAPIRSLPHDGFPTESEVLQIMGPPEFTLSHGFDGNQGIVDSHGRHRTFGQFVIGPPSEGSRYLYWLSEDLSNSNLETLNGFEIDKDGHLDIPEAPELKGPRISR
jgi:hypothetical protein